MNLAFIYDHRFYKCGKRIYSEGALTSNTWNRFLGSFDELTVIASIFPIKKEQTIDLSRVDRPGVTFSHLPYISGVFSYIKNIVFSNAMLKKILNSHDAVVVRVPGEVTNNAYWIAKKSGIPAGIEAVGCPWDSYRNHGSIEGKLLAPLAKWRMQRIVANASHVVYVTESFLQNRYPTKGKWTNASNVDITIPSENILEERIEKILQKKELIRVGLSGSFNVRYKGHKEVLNALSSVKKKLPNFRVEMIGPGNPNWVTELAAGLDLDENLVIHGKLKSGDQVLNWLDSLDLYVHPSKQEGLPRSVIEAMSRGCPVLASSIAGIPELLDSKYLHKPGDYTELAKQLTWVLNDKEELLDMANANYEKAKEYDNKILEQRRQDFWSSFAEYAKKQKSDKAR